MSVEMVKGKGWRVRACYTNAAGNQVRKSKSWFKLKSDAVAWENDYVLRHSSLMFGSDKITLSQWMEKWSKIKSAKWSPNTTAGVKTDIKHITKILSSARLDSLRRTDIDELINCLAEKGQSAGNISHIYRTLRSCLNYAVDCEMLKSNPAHKIELPKGEKFEAKVLSGEDSGKLLGLLREENYRLYLPVVLSLVFGLRRGEALGVKWQCVNFKTHTISIRGQITRGENAAEYKEILKTKSSYRELSMPAFVENELLMLKKVSMKQGILPLYVCQIDGKLSTPDWLTKQWRAFAEQHGHPGVRYHDLRHSSAMVMLSQGVDVSTLQGILGHSKITTTQGYLHFNSALSKNASESVITAMFGNAKKDEKKHRELA